MTATFSSHRPTLGGKRFRFNYDPVLSPKPRPRHVECLEAGVFRDDLPEKFVMSVEELDNLIATADDAIRFAVEKEKRITIDQVFTSVTQVLTVSSAKRPCVPR